MCRRNSSCLRPRSSRFEKPSVAVLVVLADKVALAVLHRADLAAADRVALAALHKVDLVARAALAASVVLADRVA